MDIDGQCSPTVDADAHDLVINIDRLLSTAVVIAALAGVPVATVVAPPSMAMAAAFETAIAQGCVRSTPRSTS